MTHDDEDQETAASQHLIEEAYTETKMILAQLDAAPAASLARPLSICGRCGRATRSLYTTSVDGTVCLSCYTDIED